MSLIQAFILGAIQGATEFLPVSSSGHLVLVPWLVSWPAPGLAFGAITHWGTAAAIIVYFWRDLLQVLRALAGWVAQVGRSRRLGPLSAASFEARLGLIIVLGSIPAAILGYLLNDFFEDQFARPIPAAAFLLVTALLLAGSERLGRRNRTLEALTWVDALLAGMAQAAAILPGISRSGATIAACLGRGLERASAARFSFLLSVPVVLGAGLYKVVDLSSSGALARAVPLLAVGFVVSFCVGLGSIRFLMRQLQRGRLYPYAIYCAVAGLGCLIMAAVRGA